MFIRPHTLSLITTHQCTAACDHCCFNCTPKTIDAIPVSKLHSLIDEALEIPGIRVIVFTGGECFLLGKDLFELIAHAKENNFITRCVTNGYWGTEKNVEKVVQELVNSGLDEINFSTGEEHGTYVPPANVKRAAIACSDAGIKTLINVELFNETKFDFDKYIGDENLKKKIENKEIMVQRNVWITGDGERSLEHQEEYSRFNENVISGCSTALNVLAITPKQQVVSCCGLHLERIPELHLGSIKDKSLLDVVKDSPNDFLKIWIHAHGPERILKFVKSKYPNYQLPEDSVHPCTTCLHLYNDEIAKKVISENYKEVEDDVVGIYLAGLTKRKLQEELI